MSSDHDPKESVASEWVGVWEAQFGEAAFRMVLEADGSADFNGVGGTWARTDGSLIIGGLAGTAHAFPATVNGSALTLTIEGMPHPIVLGRVPSSDAPPAADVPEPITGLLGEWENGQGYTVAFRADGVLLLGGEATRYRAGKLCINVLHEGRELSLPYELSDDRLVLGAGEGRQEFRRKGAGATPVDDAAAVASGFLQDGGYSEEDAKSFVETLSGLSLDDRRQGRIVMLLTSGYIGVRSLFLFAQKLPGSIVLQRECIETVGLVLSWLSGARLTDRADEDERRVMVAREILQSGGGVRGMDRLAARAIMSLPEGHPLRDTKAAREALQRQFDFALERRSWGAWVSTAVALIEYDFVTETSFSVLDTMAEAILAEDPDEIFRQEISETKRSMTAQGFEAIGLPGHDTEEMRDGLRQEFRRAVFIYHCRIAIRARDAGDQAAFEDALGKAEAQWHRFSDGRDDKTSNDAEVLNLMGLLKELADDPKVAADYYAQALSTGQLGPQAARNAARREASLRVRTCGWRRAIDLLEPILPALEAEYLAEVEDGAVLSAGRDFCKAAEELSFSLASTDRWDKALIVLDRAKSLRLRYRAALRETDDANEILNVEREIYATARGATPDGPFQQAANKDLIGGQLSRSTRTLEIYRQAREGSTSNLLSSPTVAEVASVLGADEACAIIGAHGVGTMLAVIFPGDTEEPGAHCILNDLTWTRLHQCMNGEKNGWLYINLLPIMVGTAHRQAIHELIPRLDQAVGAPLAELLDGRRVRRLTIIPHHFLHLAPFWTLPSLASHRITVAPSAAHLIRSRAPRPATTRNLLAVIDPTLDLPLSPAEADAIDHHLAPIGWIPKRVSRRDALEEKIVEAIRGTAILHFSGHGQSNGLDPLKSCLLLHPNLDRFAALGADPLETLAAEVKQWEHDPWQGIHATFPGLGRLYQIVYKETDTTERFLEYGDTGTLWHRYRGATLTHRAEQWRAGDIMVQSAFADCRLAFLSSCASGAAWNPRSRDVDEHAGLPAALMLAGVGAVVASLWPVDDVTTALFVDEFYAALGKAENPVDLAALVYDTAAVLRGLTREQAARRLSDLRERTNEPKVRFRLEAAAARISAGMEMPLASPYEWGAFYVTGASEIDLSQGEVHDEAR